MSSIFKDSRTQTISAEPTISDEQTGPQPFKERPAVHDGLTPEEFGSDYEQIARLAYSFWQERGYPEGSSEQDWFQAEQAIQLHKLAKHIGRETSSLASEQAMLKSA